MKKRVYLFLTLFLVCVILLALPAEAAKEERLYEVAQFSALVPSFRQAAQTPCIVNACSHTYTVTSTTRLSHRMTCSKCGDSYSQNHVFKYKSISASQHKKYCTVCNFSYTYAHDLSCTSISEKQHTTKCSQCEYKKTEKHSKTRVSISDSRHVEKCTKCNYIGSEEVHTLKCTKVDSHIHKTTCTKCDYNKTAGHYFQPIYSLFYDLIIHEYCPICKSIVD